MKKIYIIVVILFTGFPLFAQKENPDTTNIRKLQEVVIIANKLPVTLKHYPGSVSVVNKSTLSIMPRGIAVNEALRLVPGVRIDNQHDAERIHLSIRGQGILTENGIRGIGVVLDGIPLNDPSGFVPDLYDVDWSTVQNIEVLRGPFASLYGEGGAAGVIYITTENGGKKPFGGYVSQTVGSHAFYKTLAQLNGKTNHMDYRISFSRTGGNGSRNHQAFWGNILYEKINFYPAKKIKITQILSHSDYFQQNPEGLNLQQLAENPNQANPDARPYNEYQKTNRTTWGIIGNYSINKNQSLRLTAYLRPWRYKETSNKAAEYCNYNSPGVNTQYTIHFGNKLKHTIGIGFDFKWQNIAMYKLKSVANPDRVESLNETNLETDTLLANQLISQNSIGAYALYQLQLGKLNFSGSVRYDNMDNTLTDKMMAADTATTSKNFNQLSGRVGMSYSWSNAFTGFADWSQGFIPPSTEELSSNPLAYYGFNTHLVPATSHSIEMGFRGFVGNKFYYEITGFIMKTKNDFFRFKQRGRGNQEVFYGNAGNSNRKGVEVYFLYRILKNLKLQVAYTYADYKYTSASIDPVYTDTNYVLTTPPAPGQWLPNSPRHQLYAEVDYTILKNLKVNFATELQSKWAIYTDAGAYAGKLDPAIYQNWQNGFTLLHLGADYYWKIGKVHGDLSLYIRNLLNTEYMAFTEPDPDGNSYQPGPGREIFGTVKVLF
jgi:iron complex outermembrane receptor protein